MSISAGYHKIKTSSGKYLTLLSQNGTVTAATATGATNQTWNFQPSGNNWTITNTGYNLTTYAYSNGQSAASVSGNTLSTEWALVPNSGVYSIQLGSNSSNAWAVGSNDQVTLTGTQLQSVAQQFNVE
ncbi:hypothetical protein DFJ58DRAFT_740513 [Suillus subalutaceus]|uniref:uncharacterized protein n=1 Tax=Suillus subalutaceus TaxID=48586 RepID=UPI001B86B388|nr:uncharacterized protein DFJ58DRAFT_740513 [Suillus subalutaceus]KAG1877914.1 hypothetical protein DFJ58DRAFT_740513 [Suillus subalutaceus]